MSKYAPANADGEKPYMVTIWRWGRESNKIIYADRPALARWKALPRKGPGEYVAKVRRALVDEARH